ncbi:conjugal transfer protein [Clostridioides difficile]|uniref:conjugal transfer protein n=1 Tax=Clostridioides difficile TaxID=1496 RepID=UPI0005C79646|nr:conjugal transfer protein [Clostridioides difficile]EGT3807517.1 conjugal transfer protein [Clostridioides difficile]EGT3866499.1 conjugal transfer protein [Clostridioides difficile]EGT4769823.1 conjugal transfer protein [Clostridioides difficile]EGT4997550.1 conjugal transfer protein [Clostridioides difficile]EGT5053358.1 conjugal transfer protein [Clostridioides difficile]
MNIIQEDISDLVIEKINKDYSFVKLVNIIYQQDDNQITAIAGVKCLDRQTKTIQISQYELLLGKQDN